MLRPVEDWVKPQGFGTVGGIDPGLISMGAARLHPLFSSEWIRRAFERMESGHMHCEQMVDVHQAVKKLARLRRMDSKQQYLNSLPEPVVDTLVFLYFRSLDQFLQSREPIIH